MFSKNYSGDLLRQMKPQELARWISVFPEFEQTMKIHHDEYLIPSMKLIATIELMGKQQEFALHDEKLHKLLVGQAEALFPNADERTAILEYIERWASMGDEQKIFGTEDLKEIRRMLAIWKQPLKVDHVLEETSAIDRLENVQNKLDDVFYKNHFCNEFSEVAGLYEGAPGMAELSKKYQEMAKAGASPEELLEMRQAQDNMRRWSKLQTIFNNYADKIESLEAEIREAGKELAPYAQTLAEWGFDYGDSFGNKVFRGELKLLLAKCKEESTKNPNDSQLSDLLAKAQKIDKACQNAANYVNSVADILEPSDGKGGTLSQLRAKQEWAQSLKNEFDEGRISENGALEKIKKEEPAFYLALEKKLGKEENTKKFLSDALLRYTDVTAIVDLEAIVALAKNTSSEKNAVLAYTNQSTFSKMELSMVGQCLDYRYSKNSIGNAPYAVSYADGFRQLVVAYPENDAGFENPQVNGLVFLSRVESEGQSYPAVVMDTPYPTGARGLGWSKLEGQLHFVFEKAKAMGIPVIVPDALSSYFGQITEWAAIEGFSGKQADVNVLVQPGPAKATYCEISGYNHYAEDQSVQIKALVLEQK